MLKKKRLYVIVGLIAVASVVIAQPDKQQAELRVSALYGYNYTWAHYGGLDLWAHVPINPHFELDAAAELSTANLYSLSVNARPLFPLSVGDIYIDTRLLYRAIVRNRIHEAAAALSLGYRMDYVNVEVGMFTRLMSAFRREWHSEEEILTEPIDMLYSLEVFVRPQSSRWNLSLRISDFDDYQIERMWQPMLMLGGRYSPTERLGILLQAQLKPTGMFHLNASFYGATIRAGVSYKL